MMKIIILFMILLNMAFSCDADCYKLNNLENKLSEKWKNDFIIDLTYQDMKSNYYNLGYSHDSIKIYKIDWMSQYKITDNLGVTSNVRVLKKTLSTDYMDKFDHHNGRDMNIVAPDEYEDVHFRALYLTYQLPSIGNYEHMVAFGTMPFQNGSWTNYKTGRPQEANGLSMMFDMPFDALVYVADISNITNLDLFQIRVGYGEYMKFRDIYRQNEYLGLTPYDTTVAFINFDIRENNNNFKLEAYHTDWVFEDSPIGTVNSFGIGYAYDRLEEDGYVVYGTAAISEAEGSYNHYISKKLEANKDRLIYGTMQKYNIDYDTASSIIHQQLKNITPEFIASIQDVTLEDTGMVQGEKTNGWAYNIGGKKEFWIESLDMDWFIGGEYFRSSQDWVSTTLRAFPRNGIDPLIKGEATDIYTGVKLSNDKILTFSWIHENRKWVPTSINDVVGISPENTNRNVLTERDIFRFDFTWMFLGL